MEYRKKKGHHVVVVFDGWKGGSRTEDTVVKGGVRVIYSRLGVKADAVIKRIIATERQEWIVVSSDREVAAFAWSTGSIPVPSGEFFPLVGTTGSGTDVSIPVHEEETDDEHEEAQAHRKGNPRKLSRKERAIRRALCKL
jgi:predicted RNA-binding protein with PIN domain